MTRCSRPLLAIGIVALGGCGVSSNRASTPTASARLGRPVATAPLAATSTTPRRVDSLPPTRSPAEHIHLPAAPQTTSTARGVLAIAARFARTYLAYEIGHDQPQVRRVIRATCTPSLARELLAQSASVPPAERNNPAFAPATLTRVSYDGPASFGLAGQLQIALASYQTSTTPSAQGTLLIELARSGRRWLVSGVRPR